MSIGAHTPLSVQTQQSFNSQHRSQRRRDSEDLHRSAIAIPSAVPSVVRSLSFTAASSVPSSPVRSAHYHHKSLLSPIAYDPSEAHNTSQSTPTSPAKMSKLRAANGKLISPIKKPRAKDNTENIKPRNMLVGQPIPAPPIAAMSAQQKPDADGFIPPSPQKPTIKRTVSGGGGGAPLTPKRVGGRTGAPSELKNGMSASNVAKPPAPISTAKSRPSPLSSPLVSPKGVSSRPPSRPVSRPSSRLTSPAQSPLQSPKSPYGKIVPRGRSSSAAGQTGAAAAAATAAAAANRVLSPSSRQQKATAAAAAAAPAEPVVHTLSVPSTNHGSAVSPMSFLSAALPPTPQPNPSAAHAAAASTPTPVGDTSFEAAANQIVILTPVPAPAESVAAPAAVAAAAPVSDEAKQKALAHEAMRSLFGKRRASDVAQVELGHRLIAIDKSILNGTCPLDEADDENDDDAAATGTNASASATAAAGSESNAPAGPAPTPRKLRLQSTVDRQARLLVEKESRIADLDSKYVESHAKLEALQIKYDQQLTEISARETIISGLKQQMENGEATITDLNNQTKLYTDMAATNTAQKAIIESLRAELKKAADENKKLRHTVRALQQRRQSEQQTIILTGAGAGTISETESTAAAAGASAAAGSLLDRPHLFQEMSWLVRQMLCNPETPYVYCTTNADVNLAYALPAIAQSDANPVRESRVAASKEWLHPAFEIGYQ